MTSDSALLDALLRSEAALIRALAQARIAPDILPNLETAASTDAAAVPTEDFHPSLQGFTPALATHVEESSTEALATHVEQSSTEALTTHVEQNSAEALTTHVEQNSTEALAEHVERVSIDVRGLAVDAVAGGNPVIPLVQRLRESTRATFGDQAAAWIHHGATSQDILDTALMLVATDVLNVVLEDLEALADRLTELAVRYRDVPVVARTIGQQALPTTLGLRVAGWLTGIRDAIHSIQELLPLPASLGGPVGTAHVFGADGPAVLDEFASRLGLSAPTLSWHTQRGPVLGLANALVLTGAAVGKIASDVLVMSQTELGEVRESTGGTSSSMAHKSNPIRSVLIASAARQLPALGAIIGTSAVAEQERPTGAWHAEWQPLRTMLRLTGGATALTRDLIDRVVFNEDALARNLDVLRSTLGEDKTWTAPHVRAARVWVDRALAADQRKVDNHALDRPVRRGPTDPPRSPG